MNGNCLEEQRKNVNLGWNRLTKQQN